MAKSIHIYLDDELEEIIKIILNHPIKKDDFQNETSLIQLCTKRYLKKKYSEILLEDLKNER